MIRTDEEGGVLTITLDRPERRNAVTRTGLVQLTQVLERAEAPVVYLRGAGSAFCAGADLREVDSLSQDDAWDFAAAGQETAAALADYGGAVVAGVDGAARGGGVDLALACDVRVCTPEATFAESGVEMGLFGAWGGTARLPAVVGPGAAADMALTGRVVESDEAKELGLVTQVRDDPRDVAEEIAANEPAAVRRIARLLRENAWGTRSGGARPARESQALEREQAAFASLIGRRSDDRTS